MVQSKIFLYIQYGHKPGSSFAAHSRGLKGDREGTTLCVNGGGLEIFTFDNNNII